MPLRIELFEKEIIVDEVILQNKEVYLLKEINLLSVKDMVSFYIDEYLSKSGNEIGYEEVLGSCLNIGKLFINAVELNHDCLIAINSTTWKPDRKFELINQKYKEREVDLSDEIYAESTFSVVPNYVMSPLSFIKLELLRSKKTFLYESKMDMHKLSRVLEMYLEQYYSITNQSVGFRLLSEEDLYSIGNLYLHFIEYIVRNSLKSTFNHKKYTLLEFVNKKDILINDLLYFINSYDKIKELNELPVVNQAEFAGYYHWLPNEIYELQNIGRKLLQIVEKKQEAEDFKLSENEAAVLKDKIEDSLEKARLTLYNKHKKYYNVGVDLGGEYVMDLMNVLIDRITADVRYICDDIKPTVLDRSCLFLGDFKMIEKLYKENRSIRSILEANNKGEF